MKKLASLFLALALCLSLTIPASASGSSIYIYNPNGEELSVSDVKGLKAEGDITTLNGVSGVELTLGESPTIVLAPGSKNTLLGLVGGDVDDVNNITIQGTGELILYNPRQDGSQQDYGVFWGLITSLKLEDGLTMTGGAKEGDSAPLSIQAVEKNPVNGFVTYSCCTADKVPAAYIRIAPAAGGAGTETAKPSGFTDVAAGSPYAAAIQWAVGKNITTGKTADTFGPGDTCTVSHILTFLYRANGRPGAGDSERAAVIAWAQGLGIDTSNLSAPCTRAMAMTCLWKAAGSPAPSSTSIFPDIPAGADYADAVSWAVGKGITTGKSAAAFAPNDPCTRGQIVTFLYRAMK